MQPIAVFCLFVCIFHNYLKTNYIKSLQIVVLVTSDAIQYYYCLHL